jgi:1-acyl-sn-glycerol-3-phosphate acyltransferase
MTIKRQFISTVSLSAITLNLLFWIPPLVLVALLKALIRHQASHRLFDMIVDKIYRAAVWFDSFWLFSVLSIELEILGEVPDDRSSNCIVISNHRSWFDILLLQFLIVRKGPLLMFLIKQELIYVPVVGWICLALNFPRLNRGKSELSRHRDYSSVASATQKPGALMNFVEGTRFTKDKQASQGSEYQHLLKPRSGGFRIMLQNLPEATVFDFTLGYPKDGLTFWQCLSGEHRRYQVHISAFLAADSPEDPVDWLIELWAEKDQLLAQNRLPPVILED